MKLLEKLRGLFGPRKKPGRPAGAKKPAPQKKPLKIAGPDAKLTAAEKRRVKRSIQKAQRDGKIPRDAVQTIPYRELFPDGLMQVNDKLFTKTLRFSDINYELAQPEDKEQTFDGLCDFYNALDSSMWAQMSFLNLRANLIDYRKSVTVPGQGDGCDDVRRELETILQAQLAKGNNGLIKRKYFTFGIEADSGQAARPRVERIEADLRNHLKNMGVRSEPLSGYDRLEVLHGIFHPDGREKLRFNWDAVVNTGLSTKPFIAPSSFDFRGGRTFKIGGMWGAASFLQIGASQLNDRVLSDFLNLDCSQIVTIHIKAVNQQEAIKTIKRKLTDIEKTKIEEQKKAVRSGYDMDVLPPDLITYAGEAQTLLNSLQSRDERKGGETSMKPTSEILERIEKCSSEHKDGVFTRLYRYLLREDIYYAAYQKLYANKGATTQGIDDDTADGFSDFYVKELIQSLKDGTYKANPVRREYIPKKNGKLRPLGIPSFRDKLLQEVVRMILEAIYEPVFDSHSHGFRPGKSCHTALRQISSDFTGVVWFIEGDIQGCFDNINHEKLIEILSRKIKDSRFLNIIRQFLKAGYIENWKYNATYSGSPQGGICSPILANIYLNELDKKFREIAERFDKPRSAYQTPEYHAASKELKRLSYWIDHTADEAARQELIDQHRAQKKAMRNLPCKPADNKKFTFVRYADDWLAGVCGTKTECEELKAEIAEFLSTELKLTLSEEKTLITHSSEKVRFIGYDICVRRNQEVKGHRMKNGTWRKSRTLHMKVALSIPHTEKIEKFMFAKKVIRQQENGEFQPIHRAGLLNLADYEIVEQYNAEAKGLCNYYNLACDYHTLDYFCYLMEYSCLKTIANKHKTSIRKIIRQYKDGKTWSVPYETKAGTKRVRPVKIADCKRGEASDIIYQRKKFSWKTTIRQRLNARVCELCGCKEADLYEVHVIRNLNELGNSDWETVMKKKRRKTLVVCSKCHERIHRH